MMKQLKKFTLVGIVALILSNLSCNTIFSNIQNSITGNGIVVEKSIPVAAFENLKFEGAYDILLTQGNSPKLTIKADSNIINNFLIENTNNTLHISDKHPVDFATDLLISIQVVDINKIAIEGAIDLSSEQKIHADELNIHATGASKISLNIYTETLNIFSSGATSAKLSGRTENLNIELSGAGKVKALELMASEADVEISGAGKAAIYSTEKLSAEVSGAGSIKYKGNPSSVETDISGAGNISKYTD